MVKYVVRPALPSGCEEKAGNCGAIAAKGSLNLGGYGVELAFKNMEYKAMDDSSIKKGVTLEDPRTEDLSQEVRGFIFSKILAGCSFLCEITLGFGVYSSFIYLLLNIRLVDIVQQELLLANQFSKLKVNVTKSLVSLEQLYRVPHSAIRKLLSTVSPLESDMFPVDFRSIHVHYLNNLEEDAMYKQWWSNINEILMPVFPGQLRYIRKNLFHAVYVVDLATSYGLEARGPRRRTGLELPSRDKVVSEQYVIAGSSPLLFLAVDKGEGWPRGPGQRGPRRCTGLELTSRDNVVSEQAPDDPNNAKRPNETGGKVPITIRVLLESGGGECQASMGHRFYSEKWLQEGEDERIRANDEFANFSLKSGAFADPDSIGSMYVTDPRKWWACFGSNAPLLQRLAFKVLGQPTSSSCCERNWSIYSFIHSCRRNKLTPKRAEDSVFIHNNLRLLSRNSFTYYDEKTKLWDVGGDQFGSMEDVGVLEFANLSLDQPDDKGVAGIGYDPNHAKRPNETGVGRVPIAIRVLLESGGESVRPQWDRGRQGLFNPTSDKKWVDPRQVRYVREISKILIIWASASLPTREKAGIGALAKGDLGAIRG
ncbi:hypothetical protein GH714_005037 [Hevea brasiliensis]|uniref:HAT C-terminal dimerisation domain-containing protein n=1 Tax=Hevea brasiliensis TaxID=3981 RepID=A0A6A6L2B6_HEVBR|nr:hypothetical protein GH714_005037 [Hevea brasiliensis]